MREGSPRKNWSLQWCRKVLWLRSWVRSPIWREMKGSHLIQYFEIFLDSRISVFLLLVTAWEGKISLMNPENWMASPAFTHLHSHHSWVVPISGILSSFRFAKLNINIYHSIRGMCKSKSLLSQTPGFLFGSLQCIPEEHRVCAPSLSQLLHLQTGHNSIYFLRLWGKKEFHKFLAQF